MLISNFGDSGGWILRCIGKDLVVILFLFLPFLEIALEAQKPTEQELYQNGSMTGIIEEDFLNIYGSDQRLINGIHYYNQHLQSTGHKFLGEDKYQEGRLWIDNRLYSDVLLKYDIYNQQVLLLDYQETSSNKELIINHLKLQAFQLGDRVFKKLDISGTDTLIYQVFEGDQVTFFYHWKKNLIPIVKENSLSEFSNLHKVSYVQSASGLFEYKGNSSFYKIYPGQRQELKKFFKQRKINLRYASEKQILEFHSYCNQILNQKSASE